MSTSVPKEEVTTEIRRYRKRPVVIQALMWSGNNWNQMRAFMGYAGGKIVDRRIRIDTLEGSIYADEGDYVIKGVAGEFYPCKPDIFMRTYEPA